MEFGHPAALLYLFTKPLSLPRRNENKSRQGGNKGQGLPRLRRNKMENVENKKVGGEQEDCCRTGLNGAVDLSLSFLQLQISVQPSAS